MSWYPSPPTTGPQSRNERHPVPFSCKWFSEASTEILYPVVVSHGVSLEDSEVTLFHPLAENFGRTESHVRVVYPSGAESVGRVPGVFSVPTWHLTLGKYV